MTTEAEKSNIHLDDHVDVEIEGYIDPDAPKSFFLFAGAGSGKTRTLVNALNFIRRRYAQRLAFRGQKIGVITYTRAARDEIIRRIDADPLFYVATIHSFSWALIQGFNHDIREWLRSDLAKDIDELKAAQTKGRAGSQASIDREAQIEAKLKRLARLDETATFIYSPEGSNTESNALNHSEVIEITSHFLLTKETMQWLLVGRYPILLIDESQDTNKRLVDAFFATSSAHDGRFGLGLLGDVMQRIYNDGKDKIEQALPDSWAKPEKKLNHRCPRRVISLINLIRSEADGQKQEPRSDAIEGHVRLFIRPTDVNRPATEAEIRKRMAEISEDDAWLKISECKILTLEHHMAATRLGFKELLESLMSVNSWHTGALDGSLPSVRFFTDNVLPLTVASHSSDRFDVARIMRAQSPLLSVEALSTSDPSDVMKKASEAVDEVMSLWKAGAPTCGQVLDRIFSTNLFEIPDVLKPAIRLRAGRSQNTENKADKGGDISAETKALLEFLNVPFAQIPLYADYVAGRASFDTHQGVKGLEFERVMVVMDDSEARGFMFGYEKLLGAKPPSAADIKNRSEGKETGLDRTRRLLYVTCSRAERSLALLSYSDQPAAVKAHVLAAGWFSEAEIDDTP